MSIRLAYAICGVLAFFAVLVRSKKAPMLTKTKLKFLSLNLDFDISKTRQHLGYNPTIDIREGLVRTKAWMDKTTS